MLNARSVSRRYVIPLLSGFGQEATAGEVPGRPKQLDAKLRGFEIPGKVCLVRHGVRLEVQQWSPVSVKFAVNLETGGLELTLCIPDICMECGSGQCQVDARPRRE